MFIGYCWLCGNKYTSIVRMTGHSSNTITSYMNFFRELVISTLEDDNHVIGGPGIIVEIDESKFGKRKYYRGRMIEGVWVVGGIERTNEKKCFVKVVQDRSAETLHDIISRHVAPGSIVYTDLWRGYIGIEEIEEMNMTHRTVNHSENFVDPNTGAHTNTIEGFWNGLKLQIPSRNRTKNTITNYLLECIWRKKNKDDLWTGFLNALKTTGYFE
jgi:transposase-like protein